MKHKKGTMKTEISSYNRVAQSLHWVSALLIIGLFVAGSVMVRLDDGVALKTTLYRMHVAVGSLVLLLTLGRIAWGLIKKHPAPPPMPRWERLAFQGNHVLLYVVIVVLSLSGTGMLLASGVSLPATGLTPADIQDAPARQGHSLFSKLFIVLFFMHLGGVFSYQLRKGDTFRRMGVKWLGSLRPSPKRGTVN